MALELYSTTTLVGVQRRQEEDNLYWLDTFMGDQINFETEEIAWERVNPKRKLAPFVSPRAQGRVMKREGSTSKTFRPAYVKPKHEVNPFQARPRRVGEAIGGSATLEQRYNAIVAENLAEEKNMIRRRWDWMAAQAIINGSVIVSSEDGDYPEVEVDFGRDAALDTTLIGTARWGESAADPLADIALLRRTVYSKSGGRIDRLTMGLDAFDRFFADTEVQNLLKVDFRRGEASELTALSSPDSSVEYRGVLQGANGQGRIEIYTYAGTYHDYDGTEVEMMDSYDVVGTGPQLRGTRCFGAIMDKKAQLRALELFPKMWDQEDPSQTFTMTQSAPLMVPGEPNGSFRIKVFS